eukprot:15366948-Ditylum_brightwellii.AAC.2
MIPKHLQLFVPCPGSYTVFPPRPLSACSEAVGSFQATYAIFRHAFAQMRAFMQVFNLLDELQAYILFLRLKLSVPYTYIGKVILKTPDPRRLASKGIFRLLLTILSIYSRTLLIYSLAHDTYNNWLYLHELHMPQSLGKQVDQMMCSEHFFKFGMYEEPQCCVTIPGIKIENVKQVAIFLDSCKDIMLDASATKAVTPCKDYFVSFKSNCKEKRVIKGIAKGLKIRGSGIV